MKFVSLKEGDQLDEQLFDLAKDPGEATNLLEARPEAVQRLRDLMQQWETAMETGEPAPGAVGSD